MSVPEPSSSPSTENVPAGWILLNPDDAILALWALLDARSYAEDERRDTTERRYNDLIDRWAREAR